MDDRLARWYDTAAIMARFPKQASGMARLQIVTVSREQAVTDWLRDRAKMGADAAWIGMADPGTYVKLITGKDTLEMSNTRMEFLTNLPLLDHAKGRVLIAGLGLGLIVEELLLKPEVQDIMVVEKNADVIALVAPQYAANDRVGIFEGDAFVFQRGLQSHCFETIYFDIWPSMNYPKRQRDALYRAYRRCLCSRWSDVVVGWKHSAYMEERRFA